MAQMDRSSDTKLASLPKASHKWRALTTMKLLRLTKFNSIRLLLALTAHYDWEIHQMDVKSAFLNGELNEEIYMQPLPGYKAAPNTVW